VPDGTRCPFQQLQDNPLISLTPSPELDARKLQNFFKFTNKKGLARFIISKGYWSSVWSYKLLCGIFYCVVCSWTSSLRLALKFKSNLWKRLVRAYRKMSCHSSKLCLWMTYYGDVQVMSLIIELALWRSSMEVYTFCMKLIKQLLIGLKTTDDSIQI